LPNDDVPTFKYPNRGDPNKALSGTIYRTANEVVPGNRPGNFPLPHMKPDVVRAKQK